MRWSVLIGVAAFCGCVRAGTYICATDDDCNYRGGDGRCEPSSVCSYPDVECPSGFSYGPFAGDPAGECTPQPDEGVTTTSGPDATDDTGSESGSLCGDEPDPQPACDGIDCSGRGTCVAIEGEPTCACEPGTHAVGLSCREDPCDQCDECSCLYFDDIACDADAAGSRNEPMCTVDQLRSALVAGAGPSYILLRRGGSWDLGGVLSIEDVYGRVDAPLVIGAWGEGSAYPSLAGAIEVISSEHVTLREVEIDGSGLDDGMACVRARSDVDFLTVDNAWIHDCPSYAIEIREGAHCVIAGNRIENANVGVSIGRNSGAVLWPSHYLVANTFVSVVDNAVHVQHTSQDVKILGNAIASPGCNAVLVNADTVWVVGNVIGGAGANPISCDGAAVNLRDSAEGVQVSGNIVFDGRAGLWALTPTAIAHNTIVHRDASAGPGTAALRISEGSNGLTFTDNLVVTDLVDLIDASEEYVTDSTIDRNTYDPSGLACTFGPLGSLADWQAIGQDAQSQCVDVPGVDGVPTWMSAADWDEGFFAALRPDPTWEGCCPSAGAVDCDGTPLGLDLEPLPGQFATETGLGWPPPPLVLHHLR